VDAADAKALIRAEAERLGFDAIGFTRATLPPEARARLDAFLALGRHRTMRWMETRIAERARPRALWPEAVSVITLGISCAPERDPMATLARRDLGAISVSARRRNDRDVVKGRLTLPRPFIHARFGADMKVFVDMAPVIEKPLAAQAGIGWQGKHTHRVSRRHASWLFLGEISTTLGPAPAPPPADRCGSCRRCLDIRPTDAFPAPYQLDATRCISSLTVEHARPIPKALHPPIGKRIHGHDDCLAVCPWNRFAQVARQARLHAHDDLRAPALAAPARLDEAGFPAFFLGSLIKCRGRSRFVRNALIAIGDSGDRALRLVAWKLFPDPDPVLAEAARSAAMRLAPETVA
jgi:epoxyqueuosine reductase